MTPMVVQCSSCLTEFELDPNKVPAAGVRARCSVCSAVITVPAPSKLPDERGAAAPVAEREPPTSAKEQVAARAEEAQAQPEAHRAPERLPEPAGWTPPEPHESPSLEDDWRTGGSAPPKLEPGPSVVAPTPIEADSGQRRPINPFLTRDPALRAKRLARALVSDIVAYHPARHAEGLRDGTLKTLFRDEIKKSYEEYVDQVGRDFASSTTHFQDALNDVLASGKKLF